VAAASVSINSAFVFIKPHANTKQVQELVSTQLKSKGMKIVREGELTGAEIDKGMLIDQHYYAIASKATLLKPKDMPVPAAKFKEFFKRDWEDALAKGVVYNALDACTYFGVDSIGLDGIWQTAKKQDKLVKFGGGFYCGLLDSVSGKDPIYVFNGFFMSMRSKFVEKTASIHYYVIEWPESALSWSDFRGSLLGATDPTTAPKDSLRGIILDKWKDLGLTSVPNTGDNGVHASASPFEGLAERLNWLKTPVDSDVFGARVLKLGLTADTIQSWTKDPQVKGKGVFDTLEDTNADECLKRLAELHV